MLHPVGSTMSHRMRGGTLLGFLVGLVFGLSLAVIVAVPAATILSDCPLALTSTW